MTLIILTLLEELPEFPQAHIVVSLMCQPVVAVNKIYFECR